MTNEDLRAALRALETFLKNHPDCPTPNYVAAVPYNEKPKVSWYRWCSGITDPSEFFRRISKEVGVKLDKIVNEDYFELHGSTSRSLTSVKPFATKSKWEPNISKLSRRRLCRRWKSTTKTFSNGCARTRSSRRRRRRSMPDFNKMQMRDYLGDGLYVGFDGYQVILYTDRGNEGVHWVALEPEVLKSFNNYIKRLTEGSK